MYNLPDQSQIINWQHQPVDVNFWIELANLAWYLENTAEESGLNVDFLVAISPSVYQQLANSYHPEIIYSHRFGPLSIGSVGLNGILRNLVIDVNIDNALYILPRCSKVWGLVPSEPKQYVPNPLFNRSKYIQNVHWDDEYTEELGDYYWEGHEKITERIIDPASYVEGWIETPLMYMEYRTRIPSIPANHRWTDDISFSFSRGHLETLYQMSVPIPKLVVRTPQLCGKIINIGEK